MSYNCNKCTNIFPKKIRLKTYKSNFTQVENIEYTTENNINELHSLFKTCLDILRNDAEHLVGDEALHELSHFLILKQSEKLIENCSIDIYNLGLYNNVKKYGSDTFKEFLEYVKFSKFVEYVKIPEKESNIKNIFNECLWKEVLSQHPKFKDVFENGKKSFIKESSTIKKIVIALSSIDFNDYEYDILGEVYESIFVDAVFGAGGNKKSELGQFFTPPKVKKLLVNLVNPRLKDNGEIESVLDPAAGTGGILNTVIKHFKQFAKSNKITNDELRKQLINNIYGIEIKGKIYNLCLSNMLINTGDILPNVICADSIRTFHNIKVDNIIANPPFSVIINYDALLSSLGSVEILNNYIPIKTTGKNSEMLFLQIMIHCLNINGRCATVMLDGTKMHGTTSGYDKVREYLMKSCELHEVITCPKDTFTSTSSKTCILFFTKRKDRKDVIEITGKKRNLKFCDIHSTQSVLFYKFNPDTEEKIFVKSVGIDELKHKNYSLNYTEYGVINESNNNDNDIKWVELGDICEINQGNPLTKKEMVDGLYDVIGGGRIIGKHNKKNRDGNDFILTRVGDIHINYMNTSYYLTDNGFSLKSIQKDILTKYIYYILLYKKNYLIHLYKGSAQKVISKTNLKSIKLPIVALERQQEIVKFLDNLFNNKYNLQNMIDYYDNNDIFRLLLDKKYNAFKKLIEWYDQSIELLKQIDFFKERQNKYLYLNNYSNELKSLGEICNFKNGKGIKKSNLINGEYPVIGGGKKPFGYHNEYNTNENTILCASSGSAGYISKYNIKVWASDCFSITSKNINMLSEEYLYYYLISIQSKIYTLQNGAAQQHVYSKDLEKIKIPLPSLEIQKEIIKFCESNNILIKQLEKDIEDNKTLSQQFIINILNSSKDEYLNISSSSCMIANDINDNNINING